MLHLDGYIEECSSGRLRGWVWCPADPSDGLVVTARMAGITLGSARADIYRPDLAQHGKRQGYCGFEIIPSRHALVLVRHRLRQSGSENVRLAIGVQRVRQGRLGPRERWLSLDREQIRRICAAAERQRNGRDDWSGAFGAIDRLDETAISGWCIATTPDHGEHPLVLDLLIDDVWADTTVATTPRWTVKVSERIVGGGPATSRLRFRFRTPSWLRDGHTHRVAVALKGPNGAPIDAPVTLRLATAGGAAEQDPFVLPPLPGATEETVVSADGPRRGEYERWIEETEGAAPPLDPPVDGWPKMRVLVATGADEAAERAALAETLASLATQDVDAEVALVGPLAPSGQRSLRGALAATSEPLVALVAAGDIVAGGALRALAHAAESEPQGQLFYSDDDLLDSMGTRRRPRFKSAYCPDRALTDDLFSGLTLVRTSAARAAIADAPAPTGHATLALKVARTAGPAGVRHVPRVLAHRSRIRRGNHKVETAFVASLLEHEAAGRPAPLVVGDTVRRVLWPLPKSLPLTSVIIPTKDAAPLFEPLVRAVLEEAGTLPIEVVIVDNDSREAATAEALGRLTADTRVRSVFAPDPFNFSAVNNLAVARSRGEVLVFMNNDVAEPQPGLFDELLRQVSRSDVGVVGARLAYADGTNQHCGVALGIGGVGSHLLKGHADLARADYGRFRHVQTMSAVTAALMAVRREVFDAVGGFEETLTVAYNDVDLCLKVTQRTGLRVVYTPYAAAYHLESQSRGLDSTPQKRARLACEKAIMSSRWRTLLESDPYLSPNHTLASRDLRPAAPPRSGTLLCSPTARHRTAA